MKIFLKRERLYRPLPLLIYLKSREKYGQHSASLWNVMAVTQTRNLVNTFG